MTLLSFEGGILLLEKLPKDQGPMSLRVIYGELYNLTKSWARQSSIWHGRDLLDTFILTVDSISQSVTNEILKISY